MRGVLYTNVGNIDKSRGMAELYNKNCFAYVPDPEYWLKEPEYRLESSKEFGEKYGAKFMNVVAVAGIDPLLDYVLGGVVFDPVTCSSPRALSSLFKDVLDNALKCGSELERENFLGDESFETHGPVVPDGTPVWVTCWRRSNVLGCVAAMWRSHVQPWVPKMDELISTWGPIPLGDANCDLRISIGDALQVVKHVVGMDPFPFCPWSADVDCNGEVSIQDALLIVNYVAGLIDEFPWPPEPRRW